MKKNISTIPIEYGRFYKANDKIARVCGTAHSLLGGEDVILFSYVENYTNGNVYCECDTHKEAMEEIADMEGK